MELNSNKICNLNELISLKTNFFDNSRVKLVRHKDNRKEYREIIKDREQLIDYQKSQEKPVFSKTDYIISFVGQEGTKALFFGVFKIKGVQKREKDFLYDIEEVNILEEFIGRIVIDWGLATRKWEQLYDKNPKEILEILPKGYLGNFPGLTNFVLDFEELRKLITNPDANKDWKNHLSSINGIYLILDKTTGNLYIGSANGNGGIWQRWTEYVKTKTGGNKLLIDLCCNNNNYHKNFQFTVLQTLPSNITQKEIIQIESLYKLKFGSRFYGLNAN